MPKDPTANRRQSDRAAKMLATGHIRLNPIWLTPPAAEALAKLTKDGTTKQDSINSLLINQATD
jgi:hypothetical protein